MRGTPTKSKLWACAAPANRVAASAIAGCGWGPVKPEQREKTACMLRLGQTLCQLQKTVLNQWLKLLTACKQLCDPWFGGEIQCFCRRMATAGQGAREKLNQINDLVVSALSDVFVVHSVVLEVSGGQCVLLQQPVELRAVALCQARRVGYIAIRHLEQAHQVLALKPLPGLSKAQHLGRWRAQRALHQRQGHQGRGGQGTHLFGDAVELSHVARPGGQGQCLERLGCKA